MGSDDLTPTTRFGCIPRQIESLKARKRVHVVIFRILDDSDGIMRRKVHVDSYTSKGLG